MKLTRFVLENGVCCIENTIEILRNYKAREFS